MVYKRKTKKIKRHIDAAIAHVKSSFNNTVVTITTLQGDVLMQSSAGSLGHKGSRKSTPFAATQVGTTLGKNMSALGIKTVEVNLNGPGVGRESVVRALQSSGLVVTTLRDTTPLPHNGPRAPKKRRV